MFTISTQTQLQQLSPGDRLNYYGIQWQVIDYSTYDDSYGYKTAEWLLRSHLGKEYYLLREVDLQNPETVVHWYLAEEIRLPQIFQPVSQHDLSVHLWHDMQGQKTPYPELQVFGRVYRFESQTQGSYENKEGESSRITWDYWDQTDQWNLALEAWADGSLAVYSTKRVNPEDFSEIKKGFITQKAYRVSSSSRAWQLLGASCLVIVGILMMIFG